MKTTRLSTPGLAAACLLFTLAAFPAPAATPAAGAGTGTTDVRIATIDFKKVFDEYYKTRLANASIKDEASGLDKELKGIGDELEKATGEYKKAIEEANNQAVSADEREKRKKEAEGKLIKVNDLRQNIEQFKRTAGGNLEEKLRRARDNIVGEIRSAVSVKARSLGFTLVLDLGEPDVGGRPPVVIYTNGENDLTSVILSQLNSNAPSDLPPLKDTKEEPKKDEKK